MIKKKKKFVLPESEVNVVPLMDILTTMLFFLILMASTANFTIIKGSSTASGSSTTTAEEKPRFDLGILYKSPKRIEVFLGKTKGLEIADEKGFNNFRKKNLYAFQNIGHRKVLTGTPETIFQKTQELIQGLKVYFPAEKKVTLALGDKIVYESIVQLMDKISKAQDPKGEIELFPEIVLQEIEPQGDKS